MSRFTTSTASYVFPCVVVALVVAYASLISPAQAQTIAFEDFEDEAAVDHTTDMTSDADPTNSKKRKNYLRFFDFGGLFSLSAAVRL